MSHTTSYFLRLSGLAALLSVGCAPVDDPAADDSAADEVRVGGASYVRIRHDMRRCISPVCGGWWVSRVNYATTRCLDGSYARECYVADIDWSALGLSERALPDFISHAGAGTAVLRARIEPRAYGTLGTFGQLVVQEGWQALTDAAPTGTFFHVQGPDRTCVRAPCFAFPAERLNRTSSASSRYSGVTLAVIAGVTGDDVAKGYDYLSQAAGILVAGTARAGADGGSALVASQAYLRVSEGVSDARYCNADADCTLSVYGAEVDTRADCYCRVCPSFAINTATAAARQTSWSRFCVGVSLRCPAYACARPLTPVCVNHACGSTRGE